MKKVIGVICIAVLLTGMFSACGHDSESEYEDATSEIGDDVIENDNSQDVIAEQSTESDSVSLTETESENITDSEDSSDEYSYEEPSVLPNSFNYSEYTTEKTEIGSWNITLDIPKAWNGKYICKDDTNLISFYYKDSYAEGSENGLIFGIGRVPMHGSVPANMFACNKDYYFYTVYGSETGGSLKMNEDIDWIVTGADFHDSGIRKASLFSIPMAEYTELAYLDMSAYSDEKCRDAIRDIFGSHGVIIDDYNNKEDLYKIKFNAVKGSKDESILTEVEKNNLSFLEQRINSEHANDMFFKVIKNGQKYTDDFNCDGKNETFTFSVNDSEQKYIIDFNGKKEEFHYDYPGGILYSDECYLIKLGRNSDEIHIAVNFEDVNSYNTTIYRFDGTSVCLIDNIQNCSIESPDDIKDYHLNSFDYCFTVDYIDYSVRYIYDSQSHKIVFDSADLIKDGYNYYFKAHNLYTDIPLFVTDDLNCTKFYTLKAGDTMYFNGFTDDNWVSVSTEDGKVGYLYGEFGNIYTYPNVQYYDIFNNFYYLP